MDTNVKTLFNGSKEVLHRNTINKILLIQPPAFTNNLKHDLNPNPPLGIAYIAAVLERDGYEVKILDAFIDGWEIEQRINENKLLVGLPYEQIEKEIGKYDPDLVGVTSMFTCQRKNAHKMAEIVKSVDRYIPVIFGGSHPTAVPESVIKDKNVDFCVLGEGDNSISSLIKAIEVDGNFSKLNGIAYLDNNNKMVVIEKTDQIENLDEIPFPARHLLPIQKYFDIGFRHGGYNRGTRALSLISSRGCQYKCNFCTAFKVFTRRPRMRSTQNVVDEIQSMVDQYGIDEVWFEDDQLFAKRARSLELLDALRDNFNLMWDTPNGISPWLLNEEIIMKMKESGCYRVNLAIESGNQEVLDKIINKPVKLKKIPELVRLLKKYDIGYETFLVIGNISDERVETIKEIKESFKFVRKLKVIPHVSLLTAYPGSDVLRIAEEKNYLVPGFDWDDLSIQKSQIQTPLWTPEELEKLTNREVVKTKIYIYLTSFKIQKKILKTLFQDPSVLLFKLRNFAKQIMLAR